LLLEHFKKLYAINNQPFELDRHAAESLLNYSFPGNVRELRNIAIRLSSKYPGKKVTAAQINDELESQITGIPTDISGETTEKLKQELLDKSFSLENTLGEWERRYIITALEMSGGNLSKAARYLGINRTTLYSRLQRLSIKVPEL
jgi:DNA-binding NtrC family response regulator